jgi:hypothetical protein
MPCERKSPAQNVVRFVDSHVVKRRRLDAAAATYLTQIAFDYNPYAGSFTTQILTSFCDEDDVPKFEAHTRRTSDDVERVFACRYLDEQKVNEAMLGDLYKPYCYGDVQIVRYAAELDKYKLIQIWDSLPLPEL